MYGVHDESGMPPPYGKVPLIGIRAMNPLPIIRQMALFQTVPLDELTLLGQQG